MSLAVLKSYHETSGLNCETNIYVLCKVLSFPAELEENGEMLLWHCLQAINLEPDESMSFNTKCSFWGLSDYSSCLIFAITIMIYVLWGSLFFYFFITIFE